MFFVFKIFRKVFNVMLMTIDADYGFGPYDRLESVKFGDFGLNNNDKIFSIKVESRYDSICNINGQVVVTHVYI